MNRTPGDWEFRNGLIGSQQNNGTVLIAEVIGQRMREIQYGVRGPSSKFEVTANGKFIALSPKMISLLQAVVQRSKKIGSIGPVLVHRSAYNAVVQFLEMVQRDL